MTAADDDQKRKFKEALDRKNHQSKTGTSHLDGHAKADHAQSAAAHKREFRRKSG
jgi:Family of unknown function (DUF5302)